MDIAAAASCWCCCAKAAASRPLLSEAESIAPLLLSLLFWRELGVEAEAEAEAEVEDEVEVCGE